MSDTPEPVDLESIGLGLQRLTTEAARMRDDTHALAAILCRIDNNLDRMLDEMRATPAQTR
jgi:hypothetical protein